MNTFKSHMLSFVTALVALTMLSTISLPAYAQRDAGAKARGDWDPFWHPKYRSPSYSRGFAETRQGFSVQPQVETRQSYSYEPAPFRAGDEVTVSVRETKLMKGTETLAVIEQGQTLDVRKIEGPWVGTEIEVDGKKISGWVWHRDLALAGEPQVERRSFSLEPSPPAQPRVQSLPGYRSYGSPKRAPYSYPKSDPRRFRP